MDMTANLIETAGQHLFEIVNIYQHAHPEIAKPLEIVLESFTSTLELISNIRKSI